MAAQQVRYAELTLTPYSSIVRGIAAAGVLRGGRGRPAPRGRADLGVQLRWCFDIPGEAGIPAAEVTLDVALRPRPGRIGQFRPGRSGNRRAARSSSRRTSTRRGRPGCTACRTRASRPVRRRSGTRSTTSGPSGSATASRRRRTRELMAACATTASPSRSARPPTSAPARCHRWPSTRCRAGRGRRAGHDQLRRSADVLDDAEPRVRGRRRTARPGRGRRRRPGPRRRDARRSSTTAGKAALLAEIDEYDTVAPDRPLTGCATTLGRVPDPSTYRPGAGHHSARAGRLQVPRPARPGDLRRQGEEPAPAAELLLRRRLRAAPAHPADGHQRGSVEWTVVRTEVEALQLEYTWIKEFDPRFNVRYRDDKSYPSLAVTLYEEYPRLQVMRGPEAQGRALLRPVLPRLGDPRDARPAAAGVPGAHLLRRRVQARRPDRAAVPARLHRQVQRAVRRPGQRRRAPRDRRGLLRLHGRQDRPDDQAARTADGRGQRQARVRARRPAARRPRGAAPGNGEAGRRLRRRHRRRRRRLRRGRARSGRAGVPRPRRAGPRPARLGRRQARRDEHRRSRRAVRHPVLRRRRGRPDSAASRARCSCRCCPTTPGR